MVALLHLTPSPKIAVVVGENAVEQTQKRLKRKPTGGGAGRRGEPVVDGAEKRRLSAPT